MTGGLAAPAIAALLAPLGIGSILSATAAPVVLGTLFGVGGGGLAGRRVRERWGGVDEFGFVEVGHGTSATKEEIEDLKEVQKNVRKKDEEAKKKAEEDKQDTVAEKESEIEGQKEVKEGEIVIDAKETTDADEASEDTKQEVERSRTAIEERLLKLSLTTGPASLEPGSPDTTRVSTDSVRPSLDSAAEEKALVESKKPPSLTVSLCQGQADPPGHHSCTGSSYGIENRGYHRLASCLLGKVIHCTRLPDSGKGARRAGENGIAYWTQRWSRRLPASV